MLKLEITLQEALKDYALAGAMTAGALGANAQIDYPGTNDNRNMLHYPSDVDLSPKGEVGNINYDDIDIKIVPFEDKDTVPSYGEADWTDPDGDGHFQPPYQDALNRKPWMDADSWKQQRAMTKEKRQAKAQFRNDWVKTGRGAWSKREQ